MPLPALLQTPRLHLRPFRAEDAPRVRLLAGDPAVAADALAIPHPFEEGVAEAWIATHAEAWRHREAATWAITLAGSGQLVGAVGLTLSALHSHGELGYWVGRAHWGQGYATEACRAVVAFGFEVLELHRIHANCLRRNSASAGVLRKLGMTYEGCLRQHALHRGVFEDLALYGLLRSEVPGG